MIAWAGRLAYTVDVKRIALLLPLLVASCAPTIGAPSLAKRPAELIDPRLPVEDRTAQIPANADLGQQLAGLVARARSAESAFDAAIATAERLAAGAGARQSESWIAAQQALSGAVAERAPVARALADVDALTAEWVAKRGGIAPSDQAQISAAAETIAAIDRRQAQRIDAVQARL